MKLRESVFSRRKEANPSATEIMRLMTAALCAADEMGLDSVATVREQLEAEGFLPKPKETKDDYS